MMTQYLSFKLKAISFFSIMMVVLLHSYNLDIMPKGDLAIDKGYNWFLQTFLSYGITRIAVPLFFVISGYLFFFKLDKHTNSFYLKIKKRFKTLVIPYFFWCFFGVCFYFILQSLPFLKHFFSKKLIVDYNLLDWFNVIFVKIIPYQLWFLRDLIVLTILSPFVYYFVNYNKINIIYIFIIFVFWLLNLDNIFFTSEAILFFSIGSLISLKNREFFELKRIKNCETFFILWIFLVFLKTLLQYYNLFNEFYINLLLKISILTGIFSFWKCYDLIFNKLEKFLNKYNKLIGFSFFIYVFHEPVMTIVKKTLFAVLGINKSMSFIIYLLTPLITIFIVVIVGNMLKYRLPKAYEFITGNR